ncbi:MAG: OmpA family protein, partial [Myxococcota bacterium]
AEEASVPVNASWCGRVLPLCFMLFSGFSLVGCPAPNWPKCENDDHCKADKGDNPTGKAFVCVFGQCQECGRDGDCAAGDKCSDGRCISGCTVDDECGSGQTCNEKGQCVAGQSVRADACVEDGDCQSGFTCVNQRCTEDKDGAASAETCERAARVQFDFNVYDLSPNARTVLDTFARCMQSNPSWSLTIEGHADERGTTQYNLDLGDRRARAAADYLSRLGVPKARVRTVSYGEERPLDSGSDEGAWARNRRSELIVK